MPPPVRALSSSVGMKLLIGVTGLGLFVYLIVHIIGNLMVFSGRSSSTGTRIRAVEQSADPDHRDRPAAHLPDSRVQDGEMFLANQTARPVGYARKRPPGRPSRKTLASSTMIVSGSLAAGLHRHPRQAFRLRRAVRVARGRQRSLPARDGELHQPADGWLLRPQHGRRRLASVARRSRAGSVARPRPSAVDAARARRRQAVRGRSSPAASSSSRCGRTSLERRS